MSAVKVAIITGAAQGIGRAIALRLADDGLGVVVNDIPSKAKELDALVKDIVAKNRRSLAVVGDVTREADVQNLVDTTVAELGGLDVVQQIALTVLPSEESYLSYGLDGRKRWYWTFKSYHLK
jgi:NAD(P)-dependent dehydrogenase (short-subunit alcohol dehydrogenase family)